MLSQISKSFALEYPQAILWLPISFAVGILYYFHLLLEPPLIYGIIAVLIGLMLCIICRKNLALYWLTLFLLFAALGFFIIQIRTIYIAAPVLLKNSNVVNISGEIANIELYRKAHRLILTKLTIENMQPEQTPKYIRITISRKHTSLIKIGDVISLKAILRPPPGPILPGAYNFARSSYFKQIGAIGFAISPLTIISQSTNFSLTNNIGNLRKSISERLIARMSQSVGSIATALLVGDQGGITTDDYDVMRQSGLAHLLSISGLHLTLAVAIFFYSSRMILALSPYLARNYNLKQWAAIFALLGSSFYLLLTGLPAPAVRSFIMTSVILIAILVNRLASPMRSVALAGMMILLIWPESITSPSFQMSFAAVIALISSFELVVKFKNLYKEQSFLAKFCRYLFLLLFSSLIATSATSIYSIYTFHQFSNVGILANLFAVPLSSFIIMPLAIISLILMPLHLEALPLYLLDISLGWLIDIASFMSKIPFANIATLNISDISILILTLGGLWLCLWQTKLRIAGIVIILLGIAVNQYDKDYPDIIIDQKGEIFAFMNSHKKLVFSSNNPPKFLGDNWLAANNSSEIQNMAESKDSSFKCDDFGCVFSKYDKNIAISRNPLSLQEDCARADFVVNLTNYPLSCRFKAINRWDLWQNGTYSIDVNTHNLKIKHVKMLIGNRPWQRRL